MAEELKTIAREIAHKYITRCTGGGGYGPGGDGPRYHSKRCDDLAEEIVQAIAAWNARPLPNEGDGREALEKAREALEDAARRFAHIAASLSQHTNAKQRRDIEGYARECSRSALSALKHHGGGE